MQHYYMRNNEKQLTNYGISRYGYIPSMSNCLLYSDSYCLRLPLRENEDSINKSVQREI